MKARQPKFGETRCDIYLKAFERIREGLVVAWRPGKCDARLMTPRRAQNPVYLFGATVSGAEKGQGVWVRYQGAADVRVITKRRKR